MEKYQNVITIRDIAKELGVSESTVSRALHDDSRISEEVIKKVKRLAEKLGYIPNEAARSLRTGKSNTIGLLVRDINDGWSETLIPFIETECTNYGYGLLLSNSRNDPQKEKYYIRVFQQRRIEGILILTPTNSTPDPYLPFARQIPLVLMDVYLEEPLVNSITVDHEQGACLATKHLLDLGHRRIVLLVGPMNLSPCIRIRKGFKKAIKEHGHSIENENVISMGHTGIQDGYEGMLEALKIQPQPTAIVTISDLMAVGVLDAARKHGINIPKDISITGYDDIPLIRFLSPPLTTVLQDREFLAKEAVKMLFRVINNEQKEIQRIKIKPSLIIRESTTKAKIQ